MKMDKTLKGKWIRALKSGKYKKGKSFLRNDEGRFCCLGVLCKVAGIEINRHQNYIPNNEAKKLGITRQQQRTLADFNDGDIYGGTIDPPKGYSHVRGASFPVIADWIKENL